MKRLNIISLALAAFTLFSCADELVPGTTLYPVDEEDFTAPKVFVNELGNGNVYQSSYNSTPLFVEVPEDTASFYVRLNVPQAQDIVVKASLEGLPEGTWKFIDGHSQVTIPSGKKESSSDIRLTLVNDNALIDLDEYTDAKVRLEMVSGPAEVGANLNTFTWRIRNRYTLIYLDQQAMDAPDGLSRFLADDWTLETTYSNVSNLQDGVSTNYGYGSKGAPLTIDMGEKMELQAIGFLPYLPSANYVRYWVGTAEFLISDDGDNWTSIGVLDFPAAEANTWTLVKFYEPVAARYFRAVPSRNYGDYYSSLYLSDIAPFGDLSMRGVRVQPEEATVRVGRTITLQAFKKPVNAPDDVAFTWHSADPSIATVDPSTGEVTGVAPGFVAITASAGGFSSSVSVVVKEYTAPDFFGDYVVSAPTSPSSSSATLRNMLLTRVDDTTLEWEFVDNRKEIDGRIATFKGTFPYEKVDDDHYRIIWVAGTLMSDSYTTNAGAPCQVWTSMFRNGYTGNSYRTYDPANSVSLEFSYDEMSGKFTGHLGTSEWGNVTGLGIVYKTNTSSSYSNWLQMHTSGAFPFTMTKK